MEQVFAVLKGKFATITEISKWDIDVIEDDISIGTELHYKWMDEDGNVQDGGRINDGEYLWEGNKIQVDSDGKVIMINGKTAEVELKKIVMTKDKKKGLMDKFNKFIEKHKLNFKVVDKEEVPERKEEFVKLEAFAKEANPKAEKFEDVTLADGTMAVIEPAIEVGAAIVINDSEGNPVAAPVGEYELEDGRVIVVEEAGVIASITESIEDEVDDEEMEKEEVQKVKKIIERIEKESIFAKMKDFDTVVAELKTEKETTKFLKKENETMTSNFNDVVTAFKEHQELCKEIFEELLSEPNKKPVVKNNNPLAKEAKPNIFNKPYKK